MLLCVTFFRFAMPKYSYPERKYLMLPRAIFVPNPHLSHSERIYSEWLGRFQGAYADKSTTKPLRWRYSGFDTEIKASVPSLRTHTISSETQVASDHMKPSDSNEKQAVRDPEEPKGSHGQNALRRRFLEELSKVYGKGALSPASKGLEMSATLETCDKSSDCTRTKQLSHTSGLPSCDATKLDDCPLGASERVFHDEVSTGKKKLLAKEQTADSAVAQNVCCAGEAPDAISLVTSVSSSLYAPPQFNLDAEALKLNAVWTDTRDPKRAPIKLTYEIPKRICGSWDGVSVSWAIFDNNYMIHIRKA